MLKPEQFAVNEAWIAFKLNDAPITTEADHDYNVLALMDAASGFILGMEFVSVESTEPSQLESKRLLKNAKSHKQQFPGKLIVPANQPAGFLIAEAEREGIIILRADEEDLLVFVSDAREGFEEHVGGGRVQ